MNIVFCAYAYKEDYQSGHNIQAQDTKNVYLQNSLVALKSCKHFNKDTEVALVTNLKLEQYRSNLFQKNGIKVFEVKYNAFVFEKEYGWSLAFYKLCALKYIANLHYENIVLLDTDTYTQRTFEDIWKECEKNLLLCDISRGLYNRDYKVFCNEAQEFLSTTEYLTRWGGEFIAGSKKRILRFLNKCEEVYAEMVKRKFITINGDEFIESIAAWYMKDEIKNAAAYIFRYWTAYRWHYVCSNYQSNPVCVLHCPREKDHGFVKIFNYIKKHEKLPKIKKVYRMLRLDLTSYIKIETVKNILSLKN